MPIHMGSKSYGSFAKAVSAVKRRKGRKVRNPRAYVAAVERKQKGAR